jgi:hypothetical protein
LIEASHPPITVLADEESTLGVEEQSIGTGFSSAGDGAGVS